MGCVRWTWRTGKSPPPTSRRPPPHEQLSMYAVQDFPMHHYRCFNYVDSSEEEWDRLDEERAHQRWRQTDEDDNYL